MFVYKFFPLNREQIFFAAVAFLAGWNNVVAGSLAAARNWDQVIHGQLFRREAFAAIVADTQGQAILPPAALAEFP